MENISEDLGEQAIAQLREFLRLLEIKFRKVIVSVSPEVSHGSK